MSKKSFRDNPALQFMSRPEETNREASVEVAEVREIRQVKEITDNFRVIPVAFEAKSKRFNMLMRPSVFVKLKRMSENKGTSVNDFMHTIMELYIENDGKF